MIVLLVVGIPVTISVFLFKLLNRKFPEKPYRYLALTPTIFILYCIWIALYPSESFYREDYKEVTKMQCPKDAEFIYKTATYPIAFGDYTSISLIKLTPQEYEKLETQLKKIGFQVGNNDFGSSETKNALEKTKSKILSEYFIDVDGYKHFYVAFCNDKKTVLIRRSSY